VPGISKTEIEMTINPFVLAGCKNLNLKPEWKESINIYTAHNGTIENAPIPECFCLYGIF